MVAGAGVFILDQPDKEKYMLRMAEIKERLWITDDCQSLPSPQDTEIYLQGRKKKPNQNPKTKISWFFRYFVTCSQTYSFQSFYPFSLVLLLVLATPFSTVLHSWASLILALNLMRIYQKYHPMYAVCYMAVAVNVY